MKVSELTVDQLENMIAEIVERKGKKDTDDLVTITRAAEHFGVPRNRLANAATTNRLPYRKDGGIHLISLAATELYVQKRWNEARAKWEQLYGEFIPEQ